VGVGGTINRPPFGLAANAPIERSISSALRAEVLLAFRWYASAPHRSQPSNLGCQFGVEEKRNPCGARSCFLEELQPSRPDRKIQIRDPRGIGRGTRQLSSETKTNLVGGLHENNRDRLR